MAEATGAASEAEEGLDLARWGLRFTLPETEREYRRWQRRTSAPFTRVAAMSSGIAWLLMLVPIGFVSPEGFSRLVAGVLLLLVLLMLILGAGGARAAAYQRQHGRPTRWVRLILPLAHALSGFLGVGICTWHLHMNGFALAATTANVLFGYGILRLRPGVATVVILPYLTFYEAVMIREFVSARLPGREFVMYSAFMPIIVMIGLLGCMIVDRVSRQNFRQERIIESQKETIARERARSEGLLKRELSHQVAERSRELGDVLARVAAPAALPLPAPGDRFHKRYRVVRSLGEGGMGAAEGGAPFLVMELVRGGSLEERRAHFGESAWGLPILKQIALGLSVLHEAGVTHRDLKPANVLLDGDGEASPVAKISDFGISGFGHIEDAAPIDPIAHTVEASTPKKQDLTGTGVLLGTPRYMAPEASLGGRGLDAAADVFAFGLVAYEVLTGRTAFEVPAVVVARTGRPLPKLAPIEGTALGVGVREREAILACLSKDPKGRPSARRICEALGAV